MRLAIRLSGIEGLALTKLDVLAGLDQVKICVAYQLGGRRLDEMPLDLDDLGQVEPIFEELPGWSETGSATGETTLTEAALPANARAFLERISALVKTPVWVASVGPGRLETIVRHNPWRKSPPRTAS